MNPTQIKIIEKRITETGLPCDPDTERAAISCMLINQACVEEALNLDIRDAHFYDSRYRVIYNKIVDIKYLDGADVDLVLLRTKLRESEEFKKYDVRDITIFLAEIEEEPIFSANFQHYIERLEDFRQRRMSVLDGAKSVAAAYDLSVPVATDITSRKDSISKFDVSTCLAKPAPPRKWVFKDFLPQNIIASLSGAGGTGKSKLALYMAVAIASGVRIFQCFKPERPRKVLCLFGEDSEAILWERLRCIVGSCEGINTGLLKENLNIYCEQGMPLMELLYNKPVRTDAYKWLKKKFLSLPQGLLYSIRNLNSTDYRRTAIPVRLSG